MTTPTMANVPTVVPQQQTPTPVSSEVFKKASSMFNEAVKLYNSPESSQVTHFSEAANLLATSASHFMQYIQLLSKTPVTDRNKSSLVNNLQKAKSAMLKAHELRSRCLYKANQFKLAMQSFVQTIFFSDFHLMNSDETVKNLVSDLISRYVKCKCKIKEESALQPFTLQNLLQKQKATNETTQKFAETCHWRFLLQEELNCYESYDISVFRKERDLVIDQLLSYQSERDQEYASILFRKNAMLVSDGLFRQALDNAASCLAILKSCTPSDKHAYVMSMVLLRTGTCAIQTRVLFSNIDLHQNVESEKLYNMELITEGFDFITKSIDNYYSETLKWIREIEPIDFDRTLYNECRSAASILEYYGSGMCISLFSSTMQIVHKSSLAIHEKINWYVQAIRVYIDVGDMTSARNLLSQGRSLLEEGTDDQRFYMAKTNFMILESYYFITYDSLSRGLKSIRAIKDELTEKRIHIDLLSDCKYYYSLSYLRGRNIPENIDSFSAIENALSSLACRTNLFTASPNFERVNNLCLSLLQTGQIYESRGYIRESVHYLHQGLILTSQHFNISLCAQFLMSLGNIERKKCSSKMIALLVDATNLWHKLDNTYRIQRIIALIELSEAYRDSGQFLESSECLTQATSLLNQMTTQMNESGTVILSPSKGSRRSIGGSNSLLDTNHYTISMLMSMIDCHFGVIKKSLGQYTEATSMFSKALRYIQNVNSRDAAVVRYHLGVEYLSQLEDDTINDFAQQMAYDLLSTATSMISLETPTVTKPVLSAMSLCAAIQDPIWSSYLLNSSMNISLSHIKNDIMQFRKKTIQSPDDALLDLIPMDTKLEQESKKSLLESLSNLPEGVAVCTVSLSHDFKYLILSRLEHEMEPLIVSIPIFKSSPALKLIVEDIAGELCQNQTNDPFTYLNQKCPNSLLYTICSLFDRIIKSDGQLGLNVDNIKTKEETILYWKQREQLDDRMRKLLLLMENELFGFKKILLSGNLILNQHERTSLVHFSSRLQKEMKSISSKCADLSLIQLVLTQLDILSLDELKLWIHYLTSEEIVDDELIENMCQSFHESFLSIFNEADKSTQSTLSEPVDDTTCADEVVTPVVSRAAQLSKRRRRQRIDSSNTSSASLSTSESSLSGSQAISLSLSQDDLSLSNVAPVTKKPKHHQLVILGQKIQTLTRRNTLQRHHTVLIFDKVIQRLPVESMPCLRNQSITRMPSLYLLNCHLLHFKKEMRMKNAGLSSYSIPVNIHKCFYILNPSGDLQKTQAKFGPQFEEVQSWSGIIDRPPIHEEFVHALSNYSLLIYMGHGAGNQYYNADVLRRQVSNCAVSLLLGCSSGALTENGYYEPSGTVHSFLFANSPCVVSALWDITSNECDRMAQHMVDGMMKTNRQLTVQDPVTVEAQSDDKKDVVELTRLVACARNQCKLRYLMGSAMVCYGLPVQIINKAND